MRSSPHDDSRRFLSHVLTEMKWTKAQLAVAIGESASTVSRQLAKKPPKYGLSIRTIQNIERTTGISSSNFFDKTREAQVGQSIGPLGVREEGTPYYAVGTTGGESQDDPYREAIDALLRGRPNAHAWAIKSDILALKGVRAGDIAIFDRSVAAQNGDIVCAQIEDGLSARTVFRLFQAPNLIGAGIDPSAVRIETVDGERVRIAGVMTELLRRRAARGDS